MRRISVLCALLAACTCVCGQIIYQQMPDFTISATVRCEPENPVVGEPCSIILECNVDRQASLDRIEVYGLPKVADGSIVYEALENLADEKSDTEGYVIKRMRMPVRFLKPVSFQAAPVLRGMVGVVKRGRGFTSSSYKNFECRAGTLRFNVQPLPERGRPADFSGAVGRNFSIKQSLSRDHVRPNDLIKATYALEFNGYCPTNVFPVIENLPKGFTVYPPQEVERKEHLGRNRIVWTQDLVPRTVQATNTASVSFNFYNSHRKSYEVVRAEPLKLTFVSAEAASTENTSVVVTEPAETPAPSVGEDAVAATQPLVLRFAPSDGSPVVAKFPPGTPVKELATWNGWRRLEAPGAIGWTRSN